MEALAPELSNILGWIEQLGEVDVAGVEPMTAVIPNQLRLRDDVVTEGDIRDEILANAPARRARLLRRAEGDRMMAAPLRHPGAGRDPSATASGVSPGTPAFAE